MGENGKHVTTVVVVEEEGDKQEETLGRIS